MVRMELNSRKQEEEEKQESIITKFDKQDVLEVNIVTSWGNGNTDLGNVFWTDIAGKEVIYGLFETVKEEVSWMNLIKNLPNDKFTRTYESICQNFSFTLKNEDKTVEQALKDRLEELKEYKFAFNTKINFENDEEEVHIEPSTLLTPDQIIEKLISLRKQQIGFYKALLEEYLSNQHNYDERIKKKLKNYREL